MTRATPIAAALVRRPPARFAAPEAA